MRRNIWKRVVPSKAILQGFWEKNGFKKNLQNQLYSILSTCGVTNAESF